jgi:hypothetical protein
MVPGLAIEYLLDDLYVSYRLLQHFFFTFFHSTFPASAGLNVRCSLLVCYSINLASSTATGRAET